MATRQCALAPVTKVSSKSHFLIRVAAVRARAIPRPADPQRRATRIANLKRLRALPVKTVYAGHFGRIRRDRMLELISAEIG